MAEEKLKSENYTNVSGVDRKSSKYITPKNSVLTLENLDFRTVGSWSTAPGTTMYSTVAATTSITGLTDYYAGISGYGYGGYSYSLIATTNNNACAINGTTFPSIYNFVYPNNPTPFDFERGTYLYGTNQSDFFTYPGNFVVGYDASFMPIGVSAAWQYGLPKPYGGGGINIHGTTDAGGGITGAVSLFFAYLRADGLMGPALEQDILSLAPTRLTSIIFTVPPLTPAINVSLGSFGIGMSGFFPGLKVWVQFDGSDQIYSCADTISATSSTFIIYAAPSPFGGLTRTTEADPEDYLGTFLYGFDSDSGGSDITTSGFNNPTTLEVYNNQLFAAGFFFTPDDVWYSQIGEFEKHDLEGFFSVKANDGDIVSCLISYFTQLVIFKINSIHQLTGTDPDNFILTEVNSQYGCIAPRAACIWEQNLWFLDKKGIAIYNGANTKIVSNGVEDYFLRMNVPVARTQAIMLHVKERNEVWTCIPIDGASYNNIAIVYDYVSEAWWTRTLDQATALATLTRGIDKQVLYAGNYSGSVYTYGNSFFTDRGQAFTSCVQSRFHADLGHSVEKQFRRLYIDADVPRGQTYVFPIDFFTDIGTTPALRATIVLGDNKVQYRYDFGLPAKDLSFKMYYTGGEFLQINGYTLEYRFQRAV